MIWQKRKVAPTPEKSSATFISHKISITDERQKSKHKKHKKANVGICGIPRKFAARLA